MVEPIIVPRSGHCISRRDIDPDALKVLYRLRQHDFIAYLVGGSVRDLLLGRRPKDFDVGTDAHPYQIKRLFRNCWIIGRRFRLAHVRFGPSKVIEVATFRRKSEPDGLPAPGAEPTERHHHRENTFGTPEEDAFRRDFTINALFYDIATFSVIDYVGGLRDLEARVIRSIGDPDERFVEDPVRMLRAIVLAERLDFTIDPPVVEAIARHRALIATASPARLLEEYFKILRSGAAERIFRRLREHGLLEFVTPELASAPPALDAALARLDAYRARFAAPPASLTNAVLIGTLLAPLGAFGRSPRITGALATEASGDGAGGPRGPCGPRLGNLPIARRDVEQIRQAILLQPRLAEYPAPPRIERSVPRRQAFGDALTWMEIHGDAPDAVAYWRDLAARGGRRHEESETPAPRRRRRRRRRRRGRGAAAEAAEARLAPPDTPLAAPEA